MRLNKPLIRLPYQFDAARLAREAAQFADAAWMPHPSGLAGNSAVALVTPGGGNNDGFSGEKRPTAHLGACAYMRQAMASFGEVLSRSRLMKLDAGAQVSPHVDFNYHWFSRVRIHIPIVTNPAVIFHCGREQRHMGAGECWIFDSWQRHKVVNDGAEDRIHLVIDLSGSSRFWGMVHQAEAADPAAIDARAAFVPFEPQREAALRLERFSEPLVMSPGECAALVEDLVADFLANPGNDPQLADAYALLLRGFAQDWREIWLLHGDEPAGWPRYQALMRATRARLHPNRRALVTASNGIGVNAAFAQRVLNAALNGAAAAPQDAAAEPPAATPEPLPAAVEPPPEAAEPPTLDQFDIHKPRWRGGRGSRGRP